MQKVRIHPLFVLLTLLLLLMGKGVTLGATAFALLIHEFGHFVCAKRRGYVLKNLTLMPYGAVMYAEDGLPDRDGRAVAFAGPAVNIVFAVFLCSVWWFVPVLYPVTNELFIADLAIGIFNLLPCYPLDGSRMILSFCSNKKRCLSVMRVIGVVFGCLSAALFIVGLFYRPAPYLVFLSAMFFIGATSDVKKEMYRLIATDNYLTKDRSDPMEEKVLLVSPKTKIRKVCSSLRGPYLYRIVVVSGSKKIACLDEQAIEKMFFVEQDMSMGEFLVQNSLVGV